MIKVEGISKQFKLYRSPADRLKEIVYRRKYHKDFVALDNISFEVKNGETLGISGQKRRRQVDAFLRSPPHRHPRPRHHSGGRQSDRPHLC